MAKPKKTGLARLQNACVYSWQGFQAAFQHEAAFRQELFVFLLAAPFAIWLGDSGVERAILIGSFVLLLIVELLNSAIEAVVDRLGDEWHSLSGRAKDIASSAVFLAVINVIICWGFIIFD